MKAQSIFSNHLKIKIITIKVVFFQPSPLVLSSHNQLFHWQQPTCIKQTLFPLLYSSVMYGISLILSLWRSRDLHRLAKCDWASGSEGPLFVFIFFGWAISLDIFPARPMQCLQTHSKQCFPTAHEGCWSRGWICTLHLSSLKRDLIYGFRPQITCTNLIVMHRFF